MADRTDIDALLIGALYGELSSADEARLTAHLESHPADRTALEDLKSARQAVRESRIFAVQAEPPQPISALLLQEAARRAPKRVRNEDEHESWFQRFIGSFMRHPAMAAAAMLVLVLGVAGTLAIKGSINDAAVKEAPPAAATATDLPRDKPAEMAPGAAEAPAPAAAAAGSAAVDSFRADLKEEKLDEQAKNQLAGSKDAETSRKAVAHASADKLEAKPEPAPAKTAPKKKSAGLELKGSAPAPLEMDSTITTESPSYRGGEGFGGADQGAVGGGGASTGHAKAPAGPSAQQAPQQAPMVEASPPPPPPPAPAMTKSSAATPRTNAAPNDASTVEVRKMHDRARSLARNGQCREAANVVLAIQRSNLSYYNANVATDRDLKDCRQYIESEREKARAAEGKRARMNEPSESAK